MLVIFIGFLLLVGLALALGRRVLSAIVLLLGAAAVVFLAYAA